MLEVEGEWPGLDVDLPGSRKHRLEADTLLAYVALRALLGTLADITDGSQVLLGEAVLVALDHKHVMVDSKRNIRLLIGGLHTRVVVVIGVLEHLEYKSSIAGIEIPCKPNNSKKSVKCGIFDKKHANRT